MKKMNRRNRYRKLPLGLPKFVIEDLVSTARYACLHQTYHVLYHWHDGRKVGRVNFNVLGHRAIVHWLFQYPHEVEIRRYHIEFDMGFSSHVNVRRFRAHTLAEVKLMNRLTRMGLYVAKLQRKINNNLTK